MKIRIWKLGSLKHGILPTEKAINRLADFLTQWNGKGDLDIIWDSAISCQLINCNKGRCKHLIATEHKDENGNRLYRLVLSGDK